MKKSGFGSSHGNGGIAKISEGYYQYCSAASRGKSGNKVAMVFLPEITCIQL
ncbi:MAG: hypothetical protein ACKKL5_00865 [Candidatus Komeilibacteria bacterium]